MYKQYMLLLGCAQLFTKQVRGGNYSVQVLFESRIYCLSWKSLGASRSGWKSKGSHYSGLQVIDTSTTYDRAYHWEAWEAPHSLM